MKWTIDKHYNSGSVTPGTVTFSSRREARAVAKDLSVSGVRMVARSVETPTPATESMSLHEARCWADLSRAYLYDSFIKQMEEHNDARCANDCGMNLLRNKIKQARLVIDEYESRLT